ncbi:DUF1631 family protein [Acidovorax sp. M14]|uniref:DUF1631 family protein n=1 Tax=Acidovorax sp. M14 TaxID=3411354 RepID=UPI003BF460C7
MSLPASRLRTVFRACVVNAVRRGEALMGQLVKVTQSALTSEESASRNIQQRNLLSDALRLLNEHEAALVKGYPMALLEIFAEGPAVAKGRSSADDTGMDFGELSLMDESEMQAQVELSKAQQSALHATDAVLAELNTLVSAAQGLRSVQPERNPLRPESYIRALQQVVGETGVSAEVRQLWMQHMRDLLGKLLAEEYKKTAQSLREHGVQPVGYAVLGTPAGGGRGAGPGTGYGGSGYGGPGTGYGGGYSGYGPSMNAPMGDYGNTGYGRGMGPSTGWSGESQQGAMVPMPVDAAEEALLTVGILRQMLAGGDPFAPPPVYGAVPAQAVVVPSGAGQPGWVDPRAGAVSAQSSLAGGYYPSGAAAEAIEDMAQLERLVGRLAGGGTVSQPGSLPVPLAGWRGPGVAPVVYAAVPMEAATQSTAMAVEVVGRMMANIAQDARLLPPVQQAVKSLEPALKQLVHHDGRFFTDSNHPARRLLDELTQRSLAFTAETEPGFSRFMRLVTEAVGHLSAHEVKDAGPFDTVLKALQSAWDTQEQKIKAHQEAEQKAKLQAEQRELLAEKIAADIRKLPDVDKVPSDVLDFAAGPWADVVALAQVMRGDDSQDDDPSGYLALVPVLLWTAQPDLTRQETDRLNEAIPGLLAKLRKGLKTINYPAVQTSAFLQRLVALHQAAFEKPAHAAPAPAPAPEPEAVSEVAELAEPPEASAAAPAPQDSAQAPLDTPDPYADFVIGAWVELVTNGRVVRTQLTWASPHGTLFLFTAPDASTQSMTRRMRDKLAAEGSLRVVPAQLPKAAKPAARASGVAETGGADRKSSEGRTGSSSRMAPLSKSAPLAPASGAKTPKNR